MYSGDPGRQIWRMHKSDLASIVGSLSGLLTVVSFLPQALLAWRSKRTADLSAGTFVLLVAQAAGWTSYGVLLNQAPIIWTNTCVLVITIAILAAKVKHG